jgi:hypothetical protein
MWATGEGNLKRLRKAAGGNLEEVSAGETNRE